MNNEELHQQAFELAVKLAEHCDEDELSLMCYLFGIQSHAVLEIVQADWEPQHKDGAYEGQIEAAEASEDR